ncbi:MAG: hypothetical protein AAFQ98_13935, partial [Bacteroidota bacterium]
MSYFNPQLGVTRFRAIILSTSSLTISKYRLLLKLLLIVVPVVYVYVYSLFNSVVEGVIPFIIVFCLLMIPELLVGIQHWSHESRQSFSFDKETQRFRFRRGKVDLEFSKEEIETA